MLIRAKMKVRLQESDVDDIMTTALEWGINYWCDRVEVVGEDRAEYIGDEISRGGKLRIHDKEEDEWYVLDMEKLCKGVKLWLESGGDDYGAFSGDGSVDCGKIDGGAADCIVQYALFGEIVFS